MRLPRIPSIRYMLIFQVFSLLSALLTATSVRHTAPVYAIESIVPHYTGWAMDAYPGDSVATLKAEMAQQLHAGANIVWLGHNNPGEVIPQKGEPGLSYAVWAAYRTVRDPQHTTAVAIVQAQKNALVAAAELGVRVVLPIGYQIQMGASWNRAHPQDLRAGEDGVLYDAGGLSASFYSPAYQSDIIAYYRWINATFVQPYARTIFMLNLADEPADGDYSLWADRAFFSQSGFTLHQAGSDPLRQEQVGRFEANYIADYARWSADQWRILNPAVRVTMSFDGGYSRYRHEGPNLEAIFREAPANFTVTFDAYPRDGLYATALRPMDVTTLFSLIRTLGYYAALYDRPLWLWSAANSWGLNGASNDPGTIADAVANGIYLAQLVNQGGASLQGLAVWNYNIRGQGLFHDTHHLTYNPQQMFERVSASFALIRTIMAAPVGKPSVVILAPNRSTLRQAGISRGMRAFDSYDWPSLAAMARNDLNAVVLTHLDTSKLRGIRALILLSRLPEDLTSLDRHIAQDLLAHGGTVIAADRIAESVASSARSKVQTIGSSSSLQIQRFLNSPGFLYSVRGGPVENVFSDANFSWASPLWMELAMHAVQATGYQLTAGGITLFYSGVTSSSSITAKLALPTKMTGVLTLYTMHGTVQRALQLSHRQGVLSFPLERRSYALLMSRNT